MFVPDTLSITMKKHKLHFRHWTPQNHRDLVSAGSSLSSMRVVALDVLARMGRGVHLISGPLTSGGLGDFESNKRVFVAGIEHLILEEGLHVFSQMPFEAGMRQFHTVWEQQVGTNKYCWPILHEFYEALFASGRLGTVHFLHGFESSTGARWEYEQCAKFGINTRMLSRQFSKQLLEKA